MYEFPSGGEEFSFSDKGKHDGQNAGISKEDFLLLKNKSRIRNSSFNIERFLLAPDVKITRETRAPEELGAYYSPWYYKTYDGKRSPTGYKKINSGEEDGRAIRIDEHEVAKEVLSTEHLERIEGYRKSVHPIPAEPIIIAQDLDTNRTLILDGNHTAKAIYLNYLAGDSIPPIPVIVVRGHKLAEIIGDLKIVNK